MARTRRGFFESSYDPGVRLRAGSNFKGSVCPKGHMCLLKEYSNSKRSCDVCDIEIESGSIGDRCTLCDYDLCPSCSYKPVVRIRVPSPDAAATHAVATLEPLEPVTLEFKEPVRLHPFFLTKNDKPQCVNVDTEADALKKADARKELKQKPASPQAGILYFLFIQ